MYLDRQNLHLPMALNPKEFVGDMSIAVLMATFPYTQSLSSLGPSHVPAQAAVVLASGPEPKGVGGGIWCVVPTTPKSCLDLSGSGRRRRRHSSYRVGKTFDQFS